MNGSLLAILACVATPLAIGWWVSRRVHTPDDYFLAGRSLGLGLASFSVFATWFGAETCLSASGRIYEQGLSGGSADPLGYFLCLLLVALVFAAPLWRRRITTLPDFYRRRYSPAVEKLAVLLLAPTSLMWAAAQLRALGQVLDASFGLGVREGILIAAAVVMVYTMMGGLGADVFNDCLQGSILLVCLFVVFFAVLVTLDKGPLTLMQEMDPARWNPLSTGGKFPWACAEAWAVPICGSVVTQELVARLLAARSPETARKAGLVGAGLYLVAGLIPATLGLLGPQLVPDLADPEQFLPTLVRAHLSPVFYTLFTGAMLCAILSTVDSTLLAAAAVVSQNVLVPLRPRWTQAHRLHASRLCVLAGGVVACTLALSAESIYKLVSGASAFGGAGLFVLLLLGLHTRRGGARTGMAVMLCSLTVWAYGTHVGHWQAPFLISMMVAFAVAALAGWREPPPRSEAEH